MKIFNSSMGKRVFLVLLLLCTITAISFAQPTTSDAFGLNSKVKILVDLVNSPWVKGIAFIALVVECIAMITAGRQEPGMFKKFVPWIAGTIVFMAAGTIVNAFLTLNATETSSTLGLD
jgi:type IV secretory pathway VirB2 component (pilin)